MSLFGAIIKTVVNVVTLPVDVLKDACTMGGALIDEESAIKQKLKQIKEDADS